MTQFKPSPLSSERSWERLGLAFPRFVPVNWQTGPLEVAAWLWMPEWRHPVRLRSSNSCVAVCFCTEPTYRLPAVPGATAAYVTFQGGEAADTLRRLFDTLETLRREYLPSQWAGLKDKLLSVEHVKRLLISKYRRELRPVVEREIKAAFLELEGTRRPVVPSRLNSEFIFDLDESRKFFAGWCEFSKGRLPAYQRDDIARKVRDCLGDDERLPKEALAHCLTLPPYGWSYKQALAAIKICIDRLGLGEQDGEVFYGDGQGTWTRQSVVKLVKQLRIRTMELHHLPLEHLEFIQAIYESPKSLATCSAVASLRWLNTALAYDVVHNWGLAPYLTQVSNDLNTALLKASDLLSTTCSSERDCNHSFNQYLAWQEDFARYFQRLGITILNAPMVPETVTTDVRKLLARLKLELTEYAPLNFLGPQTDFLPLLDFYKQYCDFSESSDGVYRRSKSMVWGGRRFDDLMPHMLELLELLTKNYHNGNDWITAAEIKLAVSDPDAYSNTILKVFERNLKGKKSGKATRHEVTKIILEKGHGTGFKLVPPEDVEAIFEPASRIE